MYSYSNGERFPSEFIVYKVIDTDLNNDEIMSKDDISSLYLGTTDGLMFKKLTSENHNLLDYKINEKRQRIIFRTIVDTNNDNVYNEKDEVALFESSITKTPKAFEISILK